VQVFRTDTYCKKHIHRKFHSRYLRLNVYFNELNECGDIILIVEEAMIHAWTYLLVPDPRNVSEWNETHVIYLYHHQIVPTKLRHVLRSSLKTTPFRISLVSLTRKRNGKVCSLRNLRKYVGFSSKLFYSQFTCLCHIVNCPNPNLIHY
jgi:hypothetical protein